MYRCDDAEFRDRMKRAYMITMTVALNMRGGLARIRMAQAFRETAHLFVGEIAKCATAAFLCGRFHGRAEAGLDSAAPDDPDAVAKELVAAGGFDEQKAEIRSVAAEVVCKLADTLHEALGEADAVDLLSQWEGFGRFCQEVLGVEPFTLTMAFGVADRDPADEVRIAYSDAMDSEDLVARSAARWTRSWNRRFEKRL